MIVADEPDVDRLIEIAKDAPLDVFIAGVFSGQALSRGGKHGAIAVSLGMLEEERRRMR